MHRQIRFLPSCVLAFAITLGGQLLAQTPVTRLGEFKVNTTTVDAQDTACVASDAAGNFVVVWQSLLEDGSGYGIYWQLYNTAGSPLNGPNRANASTQGDQRNPAVAMSPSGAFVIVWETDQGGGAFQVRGQRYAAGGIALGTNFNVFGTILSPAAPAVAMSGPSGTEEFVVVRTAIQQAHDQSGTSIIAQRYTFGSGNPSGGLIAVNSTGTNDNQMFPSIAINTAGRIIIAWRGVDSVGAGVWGRLFYENGTSSAEFRVNADQQSEESSPSAAIGEDGSVAVSYHTGPDGSRDVRVARFDANLNRLGTSDTLVNRFDPNDQLNSSVSLNPRGGFTVVYRSLNFDGIGFAVAVQRFTADGAFDGAEFSANTFTQGNQLTTSSGRAIATDPEGNFVVVWQSANQDGSGDGIFADKFYLPNQGPPTAEFRVNTKTTLDQEQPVVAMNANGLGVVVWVGPSGNGGSDIYGQRLAASGLRVGSEFVINAGVNGTAGTQTQPAVAIDQTGRFVVAWTGPDADATGIYHQRFAADGIAQIPNPVRVNSTETLRQDMPSIAMNPSGDYVIVWRGVDVNGDGVFAQRYSASGAPIATTFLENQFRVNLTTQAGQLYPTVAMGTDGRFVVAWVSQNQRGAQTYDDIYARLFAGDGSSVIRDEFEVNQDAAGDQTVPSVAMGADGKFIVAWSSSPTNNGQGEIVARRFAATGQPDAGSPNEFRVNDTTTRAQFLPSVAIDGTGRSLIIWNTTQNSLGQADDLDVYGKRFDAAGTKLSDEFPLNLTRAGAQAMANIGHRVALDGIGNYIAVWQSAGQDGSGSGIFATRVLLSEPPTVKTLPVGPNDVASTSALLSAEVDPNGQTVVVSFEYDEDPSFGSPEVKQVPGTFTGVNPPEVPAQVLVDGLIKNVKYYYRAKASVNSQELLGNALDFTTINAIPVATDDLIFVAGSQATFQPQGNDSDGDQASLSLKLVIADKTAKDPDGSIVGSLTLGSGDTTVTFIGQGSLDTATFKYQLQDADGALSNEATVTLKSFASAGGTYQGLVTADDGTTGSLTLVLNRVGGAFSGSFSWRGITYPLDSAFPATGVLRFALEGTAFELEIQIYEDGTILGVLFENSVEIANVDLDIIDGGTSGEPVASGSYTTFLDLPDDDDLAAAQLAAVPRGTSGAPETPGGAGYILMKIKKASKRPATFVGKLPDGAKLSYGAPGLSRKRRYTLVKQLYKISKGQFAGGIVGQPQFQGGDASGARGTSGAAALQGELIWNKQAVPGAVSFPFGFPPNLRLALFALQFTASKEPIDFDQGIDPNARMEFKNGGLTEETYVTMYIDSRNRERVVLDSAPAFLPKLKIVASNALFSGSFIHPATGAKSKFYGILQQGGFGAETSGRGYFRTIDPADPEGKKEITGRVKLRKLPL